jgi:hypothetical protein
VNILFNGCSYTWGDELEDREQERFSTLVSNHYQSDHTNISNCGRSNDAIARTTMEWFAAGNTCDLAIIQWTVISRIDGYDTDKKYYCVTTQTQYKWQEYYKKYYHDQLGVDTLFKNYYLLEQFFIQRNIPYFFLLHDCWDDIVINTDTIWKKFIKEKNLHFIRGNCHHENTILESPSKSDIHFDKYKKGHPNSLGHQRLANYIIIYIDNTGTFQ